MSLNPGGFAGSAVSERWQPSAPKIGPWIEAVKLAKLTLKLIVSFTATACVRLSRRTEDKNYMLFTGTASGFEPVKMQSMARALTADDILPLIAALAPKERERLIRLIAPRENADASIYQSEAPAHDEFSTDEEPLAWDAGGWENVA